MDDGGGVMIAWEVRGRSYDCVGGKRMV